MSRRKRLYPTESVKYLGVKIDTNLTWQHHVDDLSIKVNRGNALFSKMTKYVSLKGEQKKFQDLAVSKLIAC